MDGTDHIKADEHAISEAAVWLARLRSDQSPPELASELRAWLDERPEHRAAFEAVNDSWELAGGIAVPAPAPPARRPLVRQPLAAAIAACLVAVAAIASWQWSRAPAVATDIGERRVVALGDGSTVTLNTDTRLHIRFDDRRRLVELDRGEASFAVAKDSLRPFIVDAGGTKVVAVGTVFDVRWTEDRLAVTLAKGKVRVVGRDAIRNVPVEVEMNPGERLEQRQPGARPTLKPVDLDVARAWQKGRVLFDNTPLRQAIGEMNRYSEQKLSLDGLDGESLTISGSFKAGDSVNFGRALAQLYSFDMRVDDDRLVLRPPAANKKTSSST